MARRDDLVAAYDAQVEELVGWLRRLPPDVADQPSRLPGWTVRELAFHTTEVPRAFTAAVATAPTKQQPLSIAEYTAHWRPAAAEIAQRDQIGAEGVTVAEIVARHAVESEALHQALAAVTGDVVVAARRGPIRVLDLLTTRVNELVVHSLDLSASAPTLDPVGIGKQALGFSCRMLTGILVERVPGHTVEVRIPPYSAVQCVEGPRHTRGTPPNVVEVDAMTWIEIATGRIDWGTALADGRLRISGERADISEHLPVLA